MRLSATNADGTTTVDVSLSVQAAPTAPPVLTPPPAHFTIAYGYSGPSTGNYMVDIPISATNAPTSFSATGLPGRASLDPAVGVITYDFNEVSAGVYTVNVSATNGIGTGSSSFQWTVHPALSTVLIDRATLSTGDSIRLFANFTSVVNVTGTPYVPVHGGTRQARYVSGSGTARLTFEYQTTAADGTFSEAAVQGIVLNGGTIAHPSGASVAPVENGRLGAQHVRLFDPPRYSVTLPAPTIAAQTASGTAGSTFNYVVQATNATSFSVASGTLPAGLSLSTAGVIAGTPTAAGTASATIRATNSTGSNEAVLTLNIAAATPSGSAPVITSPLAASVQAGQAFNYTLAATNSPTSLTATNLPAGLAYNSPTISGTVAAAGSYNITLGASNSAGSDSRTLVLTVTSAPPPTQPPPTQPPPTQPPPTQPPPTQPPPVAPTPQTIDFSSPVSAIRINTPITLSATSSAGLPVTFTLVSGNATIEGNVLTPRGPGQIVIRATQAGTATVAAASTEVNFGEPDKAAQAITLASLADMPASAGPIALNATASSGLPVTLTVAGPARIEGGNLVLLGAAGTVQVRASQPGNDIYERATEVVRNFNVLAAAPQVYLGISTSDTTAIVVAPSNTQGSLLTRLGATGEILIARFTIGAGGAFTATARTAGGNSAARTISGTIVDARATATVVETGAIVSASVAAPNGPASGMAGFYTARVPGSASDEIYLIAGPDGQALAVVTTAAGVTSGSGRITADGTFTITVAPGTTITGTVESTTGLVTGTLAQATASRAFAGLSDSTSRTDRLINLSSRLRVVGGDSSRSVIAGFVVTGTGAKQILVRAVGPGLSGFGVQDALANPRLQLYRGNDVIAENDDWAGNAAVSAVADRVGAFRLTATSRDSALTASLTPGAYTAVVTGGDTNGVALIEIYDASADAAVGTQQLINISTRGFVESGEGGLIAGFVITGNAPKRVLIRGVGPGLARFGVAGTVSDPTLRLLASGSTTVVAQNDNWATAQPVTGSQAAATAAEISAAATATGAFALEAGSRDAAIVTTLLPGQYSAVVSGSDNATGAALVEVYELPEETAR